METFLNVIFCFTLISKVIGVCYFPVEYQGIFSTQSTLTSSSPHKYSQITILPDAIPVWGVCHAMEGPNAILHDGTGGQECFRCFQIYLRSPNVIQVYTEGLDKCYTQEGAARASCPDKSDVTNRVAREIMLYKSKSFSREGSIDRIFCPFSGKYHFTYDVNDGFDSEVECPESKSVLSNCPRGSQLELRFIQCKFRDTTMGLRCLGDWTGVDGYRYFALWDTRVTSETQPQYRCGMFHVDEETGRIFISFSNDATCTNRLQSPWDGYETMILTPPKTPPPPAPVHSHSCLFPKWMNGKWKDMQINGRELIWKDEKRDKVYQTLCLTQHDPNSERYSLYSLNQCEDQEFTCIWIKKRDINVMEYKIATVEHNYFNDSVLCNDVVFIGQTWHTQGRLTDLEETNCPVLGEYTGVIPDDPDLCARLASNCEYPQLMHYSVYSCSDPSQLFEGASKRSRRKRDGIYRITNPREMIEKKNKSKSNNINFPMLDQSFVLTRHGDRFSWTLLDYNPGTIGSRARIRDLDLTNFDRHSLRRRIDGRGSGTDYRHSKFAHRISTESQVRNARSDSNDSSTIARRRHQRLPNVRGSDPSYVFSGVLASSERSPKKLSAPLPLIDEKPFYYVIDKYGNEARDIASPISLVADREYQCLGQWKEDEIVYTYTHRQDVSTYECFAGTMVSKDEAFIVEAGVSCQRGLLPLVTGMKLVRQATCDESNAKTTKTTTLTPEVELTTSTKQSLLPAWWPSTSRKPWLKKSTTTTQKPPWKNQKPREVANNSMARVTCNQIIFLLCFLFHLNAR